MIKTLTTLTNVFCCPSDCDCPCHEVLDHEFDGCACARCHDASFGPCALRLRKIVETREKANRLDA